MGGEGESRSEALPVDTLLCQELDRRWAAHLQNPEEAGGPPSAGSTGRRRLVVRRFPYAVYFREVGDEIVVLTIHGRQNLQRYQDRS